MILQVGGWLVVHGVCFSRWIASRVDEDQVPTPKKTVKFQVDGVKFLLATNSSCSNDFLKISRWVKSLKKNDQKQFFF